MSGRRFTVLADMLDGFNKLELSAGAWRDTCIMVSGLCRHPQDLWAKKFFDVLTGELEKIIESRDENYMGIKVYLRLTKVEKAGEA
jgi:hypothetical protein